MIEQIATFFTIEMIYLWLNFGILPFWFILMFFPQSKVCGILVTSIFPFFMLAAARMKNGKIEVTSIPQTLDCGKNIKINQNGNIPKFNHK